MDVLISVCLVAALGVHLYIICDYMYHIKKMKIKRIAAIMSPVWIAWALLLYFTITY